MQMTMAGRAGLPGTRRRRRRRIFATALVAVTLADAPAIASAAPPAAAPPGGRVVQQAGTVTMCGARYCATLSAGTGAAVTSLRVDGHELLDPAKGIFSSVTTPAGTVSTAALAQPSTVTVERDTVTLRLRTPVADETWTFRVGRDALRFTLDRRYLAATTVTQQGTPAMTFAQDAFDAMRWPGDGGAFPLGGPLVNTYQQSWLAAGARFAPNIRAAKEQVSYSFLDAATHTALRIDGSTNHATVERGQATELWRTAEDAGHDLNVAVLAAADGLRYASGSSLGYSTDHGDGHVRDDGQPVFQPVMVAAGQHDRTELVLRPDDYDSYYDLGDLRGVDETSLTQAINVYGRWMMQDTERGASTEASIFKAEVPPLEMHWLGQLLELFPEPNAIKAFQAGLDDIRDYLVDPATGKILCCRPLTGVYWGTEYGDQAPGFALGVVKAYQLGGDRAWLAGMAGTVERGLQYVLDHYTAANGLVGNVDPLLPPSGYNNNYWESSTGTYDGYSSALLYDALTSWARLAQGVLRDPGTAARFTAAASKLKASFNKNVADGGLWSPETHTYLYGSGNQDVRYLPVNAEVLKTDLAPPQRRRQVTEAIVGQNAAGNYDLHPMNVGDLFLPGTDAPGNGKIGENGGWYGAPDGDFYAGLPTLDDPQVLQTAIASFLTRYQADGFYGASAWDRNDPLRRAGAELWFPTTVMPAWGLYHYGYGFQPAEDRLVLAPYIAPGMTGSTVKYTWRGTPLAVRYASQSAYQITADRPLPTPVDVRWSNQRPGRVVHVLVDGHPRAVTVDAAGTATATIPAGGHGRHTAACLDCAQPGQASDHGTTPVVTSVSPGTARNDAYQQIGAQLAIERPLMVTSLSRYKLPGNRQQHRLKLLDAEGRIVASATVDMGTRADRRGFVHAPLAKPVTVQPGIYYLYSSETPGGDTWYNESATVTTSSDVTFLSAAYGRELTTNGGDGHSYGPVSLNATPAGPATPWIQQVGVEPADATAPSGGTATFRVTLWGQADRPITGTVTPTLPPGWSADPAPFTVDTHGQPASTTATVTVRVAADAPTGDHSISFHAATSDGFRSPWAQDATVSVANIIYGFDDGTTQGWQGDPPVVGLEAVTSFANGPRAPFAGSHALQVAAGTLIGPDDPRTIHVEPTTPLDLSDASSFYVHVNSYGYPPYTQAHQVRVTLYSGDDTISATSQFQANAWTRADVDISSWAGRASITRIEVTYTMNIPAGATWAPYVDLDSVGWDAA